MKEFDANTYKDLKGDFNDADETLLVTLLYKAQPSRMLDIGCGDGKLTKRVAAEFPEAAITAIDNSADQIALAAAQPSDIVFKCASITDYAPDQKFDTIFSFYAFPHMPKSLLPAALSSAKQLLEDGGVFYLFTNICLFDTSIASPEDQEACDIVFLNDWHEQINLVSLEEMKRLILSAGFRVERDEQRQTGAKIKEYGNMISWLFILR
ncbi:MAG: class I SAM-dependent methyltransferase [bacterium]